MRHFRRERRVDADVPSEAGCVTGLEEVRGLGLRFSLPATYAAWMAALIIIYPMCVWYARLKVRHPEWRWLSYL